MWVTENTLESGLPFVKDSTIEQCAAIIAQHDGRLWAGLLSAITSELICDTSMNTTAFIDALVARLRDMRAAILDADENP